MAEKNIQMQRKKADGTFEAEAQLRNPAFQVPEPPLGLERRKTLQP